MKIKLIVTIAASVALQSHLFAEDGKKNESPAAELAPYEIYAYRFADNLADLPVNAQLITADKIADYDTMSMPDILRKEANLEFKSATGSKTSGNVSMRGYGGSDAAQAYTLVLLDGQRLNPMDMGSINWLQINPNQIESVEVLRGAQSAIYGNNAVAGVIKITSKSARDREDGVHSDIGGFYGSYDEYSGWGSVDVKKGSVFASANMRYYHDGGYRANSETRSIGGGASVGYIIDDYNEVLVRADYTDEYMELPGDLTYAQYNANPRQASYYPVGNSNSGYGTYTIDWKNKTSFGEGGIQSGINTRDLEWKTWGALKENWMWSYSFAPKYRVYLGDNGESNIEGGVDFTYDSMDADSYADLTSANKTKNTDISRATVGPWVGGKLVLNDTFTFNAAARIEASINSGTYSDYASAGNSFKNDDTQIGPAAQFGATAKLDKRFSAFFRFDQLYRYPTFDEMVVTSGYGAYGYNKDLDPEHGQNYEIGLNYRDEFGFKGSLSLFYSYINNQIAWTGGYLDGHNTNIDEVQRYGIDLSLSYEHKYFGASTAWTFIKAEFDDGDNKGKDMPLVPNIMGTNQIWLTPTDFLRISFVYTWTSAQYMGNDYGNVAGKMDDYGVFDIRASVKIYDHFTIFAAIENLTDEKYCNMIYWGQGFGDSYYPASGRTFRVGARFSW